MLDSLQVAVERKIDAPDQIGVRIISFEKAIESLRLTLGYEILVIYIMTGFAKDCGGREFVDINHRIHDACAAGRSLGWLLVVVAGRY